MNTWGTLKDFKHFAPRILELYATREMHTDLQIIYSKFRQEGPSPEVEMQAVAEYTKAIFDEAVASEVGWDAVTILESAGLSGSDVRALAADAFSARPLDDKRASTLADIVRIREKALVSGDPGWIWWKDAHSGQLEEWLLSGAAHEALGGAMRLPPNRG